MGRRAILIRVPATVGSFGGALDCAALAFDAPLNVKVTPKSDGRVGIRYFGENGECVPRDRSNLVVRAMQAALQVRGLEFIGADFEIYSSVPVAAGLGSSTAAVLAGLLAADRLFHLGLDEKTLFELAAIYENRQDNLKAAWYGGFVVSDGGSETRGPLGVAACHRTAVNENLALNVIIPQTHVVFSRPEPVGHRPDPVPSAGSAYVERAMGFAEFFAKPAKPARSLDAESRKVLPPPMGPCLGFGGPLDQVLKVEQPGALSVFVCGSGPAIGVLSHGDPAGAGEAVSAVREYFGREGVVTRLVVLRPTNSGAREWNAIRPDLTLPPSRGLGVSLPSTTGLPV